MNTWSNDMKKWTLICQVMFKDSHKVTGGLLKYTGVHKEKKSSGAI